ncbi:MAG: glycoside hydrolase family 25 protein [Hydrogenophilaceae bacterium]|jgi:lysozyme|nr:glycoside hydrolase family 25 protein [Hydrogenophilaceae bacterium]
MRRGVLALAAIAAAALLAATVAIVGGWWAPWAQRYVQGVDVSWHQGAIDWRALAGDDVAFAYIKATEGADHVDPRFARNWADAARAGVLRGAYHFFTLCRPGAQQAENFIRTVPRAAGTMPPALDLEHKGPCREGPTMRDVVGEMGAFLERVEAHYGVRPILYTTREFHDAHLAGVRGERFWLRSLFRAPDFRERDWVIWQHHNRGRKRGVSGPIDLNAFRGDAAALVRFANSTRPST